LAIGVGLGLGAGQALVTIVAFIVILGLIVIRSLVRGAPDQPNLYLTVTSPARAAGAKPGDTPLPQREKGG